jgi:hypothetical protein
VAFVALFLVAWCQLFGAVWHELLKGLPCLVDGSYKKLGLMFWLSVFISYHNESTPPPQCVKKKKQKKKKKKEEEEEEEEEASCLW